MGTDDRDVSRRSFVKQGSFLLAGTGLSRNAHASALATRQERKLGVAIVGLSSLSTNQIAPALLKTTHCRLAAIVTGTPAKGQRWKSRYNLPDSSVHTYETMSRLADNANVDIVYVVTPNAMHAEHSIAALKAGKHVLCEKPMEISVERCNAMIAAAKAARRQLAIGDRCRFEPHHLELARLAREHTLGTVRMVEAGFGFAIGDPAQWRLNRALAGGGPLMDVGIYALQSARMIAGEEPRSVSAQTVTTDNVKFKSVEESMTFDLVFPGGVIASCRTSYAVSGLNRVSAFTERGSFGLEPAYNYDGNRGWRSDGVPLRFAKVDQFATELDDFAQCIKTSTSTRVPGEEGLRDVRILMAAYESARTGRSVQLRNLPLSHPSCSFECAIGTSMIGPRGMQRGSCGMCILTAHSSRGIPSHSIIRGSDMSDDAPMQNWAGNITYQARHVAQVGSIEELQELVQGSTKIRALGSRHSFNGIADTVDTLVSMKRLDRVLDIDTAARSVTIEGGVRYGDLGAHLHREGWALHNLASLPHISVAGACATATHGSGERNGNLATAVSAIEFVTASGALLRVSRETHPEFNAMAASLGALGIAARMTLDIVPAFEVQQHVFENLLLEQALEHFDEIQRAGYSVSLFTDWTRDRFTQVWVKRLHEPGIVESQPVPDLYGAPSAEGHRHPIAGVDAESCTPQLGEGGAWHERLPHFRMGFTPSNGEELQSEYFVARKDAAMALRAVMRIGGQLAPQLFVSEVRTIAVDTLWLSPCYLQDSVALHFTWKPDWAAVRPLLHLVEESLAPFAARPHWGKLFVTEPAQIAALFPRLDDFRALRNRLDPDRKFLNEFVARVLGERI